MSNVLPIFKWFQHHSYEVSNSLEKESIVFPESAVDNSLRMWTDLIEEIKPLEASVISSFNAGLLSGDTLPEMPEFWPDSNIFRKCLSPEITSTYFSKFCDSFGLDESEIEEAIFLNLILDQFKSGLQFHKCHWLKVFYGRMSREFMEELRPNDFYKLDNLECFKELSVLERDYVWGLVTLQFWTQESEFLSDENFMSNYSASGILTGKLVLSLCKLSNSFWVDSINEYNKLKSTFGGEEFLNSCYDSHNREVKSWGSGSLTSDISRETAWVLSTLNLGYVPVGDALDSARSFSRGMSDKLRDSFFIKSREIFVRQVFSNAVKFSYILGVFTMLDKSSLEFLSNRSLLFSSYFSYKIMECFDYGATGILKENAGLGLFAVESFWDVFCRKMRFSSSDFNRYQSVNLKFTPKKEEKTLGDSFTPSF